jgi:hypothetical protein
MSFYNWESCPGEVKTQAWDFVQKMQEILSPNLAGIYLHGSLAMGCFNPAHSDLDLLVTLEKGLSPGTKRLIFQCLLAQSGRPIPIEVSFLSRSNLFPWRYPTPFELHYSEDWRSRIRDLLADPNWNDEHDEQRLDEDLAAHLTIARARGISLFGLPALQAFPMVPEGDYSASILADTTWALERLSVQPVYAILNLCRVYAYLREGKILSKKEGGEWGLSHLAQEFQITIQTALRDYEGDCQEAGLLDPDELCHGMERLEKLIKEESASLRKS